ncbi:MAG: AAA family ATPase [Candidatus Acidiferrum sp.]
MPKGQEIRFGPQLTLLYGNNGAGKSGYARALGSAGFARGKREVLPNAIGPGSPNRPQLEIEIGYADRTSTVQWSGGPRCPELAGFYVFDEGSLAAHLTESNSLSFTPGGLSILTRLSDLTDLVREKVKLLIERHEPPNNFQMLFAGQSAVRSRILELDQDLSVDSLMKLARLTREEQEELVALEMEIAKLKLLKVPKQIERRSQEVRDLEALIESIERAGNDLGEANVADVNNLVAEERICRASLEQSSVNQFQFPPFSQVGTNTWRVFITAAKALADAEAKNISEYPSAGDHCLLCRQSLSEDSIRHIHDLWIFLQSDAQAKLNAVQSKCSSRTQNLERLNLNYLAADSNARRILDDEMQIITPALDAQIEAFRERRREMQDAMRANQPCLAAPLIRVDLTEIRKLISVRKDEIAQLQNSDSQGRLTELEQSFRELNHRQILGEHLPEIDGYVRDRNWALVARQSLGSTRSYLINTFKALGG